MIFNVTATGYLKINIVLTARAVWFPPWLGVLKLLGVDASVRDDLKHKHITDCYTVCLSI